MEGRHFRRDMARTARAARFSAQLAGALYELGLTHAALAGALGVPRYTVDAWTRGENAKIPNSGNLTRLSALLEGRQPGLGRALLAAAGFTGPSPAAGPATLDPPRGPAPLLRRPATDPTRSNLPLAMTSFVGREQELATVRDLLTQTAGGPRLVTLTGPGGVGKTRLALEVGAALVPEFAAGVWLVELAALSDPPLVARTVAAILGVREASNANPLQALIDHLREQHLLLLLDNCEHLVDACAALVHRLLRACPHLVVLATSRSPLGIAGELAWPVPVLPLPTAGAPEEAAAIRLFRERARAAHPAFALTTATRPAVVQICRRLDGLPLAIELAAACLRVLTVEQIAARLDDRFHLLTAGSRLVPPHQQTLQATIDWSYALLDPAECGLFARLAVFAGGWTLEAAEAIGGGGGSPALPVLSVLRQLVDKSLVLVEDEGPAARYRMLETIRQFAGERLRATGDESPTRDRHLAYFLQLAEEAEPAVRAGPAQGARLAELEQEHDNLWAALDWALTTNNGEAGLRLAGALHRFWEVHGHLGEGQEWLARLLAQPGRPTPARGKALGAAGRLAYWQGRTADAAIYFAESVALGRAMGNRQITARGLLGQGTVALYAGDYPAARRALEESLALGREMDDSLVVAAAVNNLGDLARYQGDYAAARARYETGLALARAQNDGQSSATILANLGQVALHDGNYPQAAAWFAESLEQFRALGNTGGILAALAHQGEVARGQGDYPRAIALFAESLTLAHAANHRQGIAGGIEALARVAAAAGHLATAARLLGAVAALRQGDVLHPEPPVQAAYARTQAAIQATLDAPTWEAAWGTGQALSPDQAVAAALAAARAIAAAAVAGL